MKRGTFLPPTDLSEFLTTKRLMEAWYLLASDDVAVLVDTVKPRIYRVFTFGRFGTLQQLIYDTCGAEQDHGFYGIVPVYRVGDNVFYPFMHRQKDFTDNAPERIEFDPKKNRLRMQGIQCYDDGFAPGGKIDWTVTLKGTKLTVDIDFPHNADSCELSANLYPLYTDYQNASAKQAKPVEYFTYGFLGIHQPRFEQSMGKLLTLTDRQGQMPGLKITAREGECRLISHADSERSNAFRLNAIVQSKATRQRVDLDFLQNPVTVRCRPYYIADQSTQIQIASREKPTVTVDGKPLTVRAKGKGVFVVTPTLKTGKHTLLAETKAGRSKRTLCALGAPDDALIRMGQAVAQLPWKNGPMKDLMPYFYYYDPLEPAGRGETADNAGSFGSHSLRAITILIAVAMLNNDRRYVERAYKSLQAVVRKSHQFDDGDLLFPHEFDLNGKPYLLNSTRPSDLGLMVRALRYTYHGFQHLGDQRKARACLELAYRYAHTLTKMQQPDGSFFPRYFYPTLNPNAAEPMGTVNNWAIQIWELANLYESVDREKAQVLRDVCIRHADFLLDKNPSLLRITGGGEDPPNYMDGLSSSALFLMIKFLQTNDPKYKQYAHECFMMGALTTTIFIDQPQNFFCANSPWLPLYYNQPDLPSKGGMHALTMIDAGLFLKKYLDDDFALYVASFNFANRLIDCVMPNGAIYGMTVEAPNVYYRRQDAGETLDFGCVGIYGHHYARSLLHRK